MPALAVLAGIVLGICAIGFLAARAYAVMFGLEAEFARESPRVWFEGGMRTLPLVIYAVALVQILWAVGSLVWRVTWGADIGAALNCKKDPEGLLRSASDTFRLGCRNEDLNKKHFTWFMNIGLAGTTHNNLDYGDRPEPEPSTAVGVLRLGTSVDCTIRQPLGDATLAPAPPRDAQRNDPKAPGRIRASHPARARQSPEAEGWAAPCPKYMPTR